MKQEPSPIKPAHQEPTPTKLPVKQEPIPIKPTKQEPTPHEYVSSSTSTRPQPIPTSSVKRPSVSTKPVNDTSNFRNNSRNGNQTRSATVFASSTRKTPISLPAPVPKTMLSSTPAYYYRGSGMSRSTSHPVKPANKLAGAISPRNYKPFYEGSLKKTDNSTSPSHPSSSASVSSSAPSPSPFLSSSTPSPTQRQRYPLPHQGSPRTGSRHVHELAQQFNSSSRSSPTITVTSPASPILSFTPNNSNNINNNNINNNNCISNNSDNINLDNNSNINNINNINNNNYVDTTIPITVASAPRDIPQVARKGSQRSVKRPSTRQTPPHTHSLDIFFPLPNSPLMDRRRSRKRPPQQAVAQALSYAQEIAQRKPGSLERSQSSPEVFYNYNYYC